MNQEIDPRGSLKRRRALVLFAALGVVVYMALALATDTDALTSALHKLGWLGSGTVLLLSLLNYGLRCQRWTLYLVRLGHALPGPQLLLCYLGGFAFTVSPAKAGEAVRSLYLRDHGVSYADSIAALFVERLLDLLAMALLAGLVVLDQPAYWPVLVAALAATVGLLLVISQPALPRRLSGLAARRGEHGRRARLLGALSAKSGAVAAILLLAGAFAIAALVNARFCAVLAGYYGFTWIYSLALKRKAVVDVMMLAGLYTIRIVAGAAATSIALSFWLLAFSIFLFLSLGIVKRYTELDDARRAGGIAGRGYSAEDLPLLMSLGTAAGYSAIVVMALYVNSPDSMALYRHSRGLWLICPLMLFWVSRIWLLTTRGQMHDDPLIFALRDRTSLLVAIAIGAVVLAAT
ncbi:MAG: hypothetical protein NVS9B10_31150 [Nevskia sp.]